MRISDWSSDVCSSDLLPAVVLAAEAERMMRAAHRQHRGARRKTLVEDIDLGIGVTPELQGEQCQQHRLARAGRANNEHVADVTDMGREPERGRSARLGIEQGRSVQMRVACRSRPYRR